MMTEHNSKLVMINIPPGTMKDDIKKLILQWKPGVLIQLVDLGAPFYKHRNMTVYAFVYFVSAQDCHSVLDYYNANFATTGFLYKNKLGLASRVVMSLYTGRKHDVFLERQNSKNVRAIPELLSHTQVPSETVVQLNGLVAERKLRMHEIGELQKSIQDMRLLLKERSE